MSEETRENAKPTTALRAWIKDELERVYADDGEVDLPTIADAATAYALTNQEILHNTMRQACRELAYAVAAALLQSSRTVKDDENPLADAIKMGDTVLSRKRVAERGKKLRAKWHEWWEHTSGKFVRLGDMTKSELLAAATERQERADHNATLATLWRSLAEGLAEGEKVKDKFTEEQIDALRNNLTQQPEEKVLAGVA